MMPRQGAAFDAGRAPLMFHRPRGYKRIRGAAASPEVKRARAAPAPAGSPMIRAIGVDIVDVRRIERIAALRGRTFLDRVFLPAEQAFCDARPRPGEHYAARFAAKEAVLKVLGTGWAGGLGFRDVEVVRAEGGRPEVRLSQRAGVRARDTGVGRILLSLSHTAEMAIAEAIGLA